MNVDLGDAGVQSLMKVGDEMVRVIASALRVDVGLKVVGLVVLRMIEDCRNQGGKMSTVRDASRKHNSQDSPTTELIFNASTSDSKWLEKVFWQPGSKAGPRPARSGT